MRGPGCSGKKRVFLGYASLADGIVIAVICHTNAIPTGSYEPLASQFDSSNNPGCPPN